jgi:hypothetical protein
VAAHRDGQPFCAAHDPEEKAKREREYADSVRVAKAWSRFDRSTGEAVRKWQREHDSAVLRVEMDDAAAKFREAIGA